MSLAAVTRRAPCGAIIALFVALCAAIPVGLLARGWEREDARRAVVLEPAKGRLLLRTYGKPVATALAPCPPESVYFAVFSLLLTPIAALGAAASRRSDQRRGRMGRARHIAVAASVAAAILAAAYALSTAWLAFTGPPEARSLLYAWMPRLWCVNAIYALPYVALAVTLGAVSRGAIAVAAYCGAVAFIALVHALLRLRGSHFAEFLPSGVDGQMLAGAPSAVRGAAVAASWALAFVAVLVLGVPVPKAEEEVR